MLFVKPMVSVSPANEQVVAAKAVEGSQASKPSASAMSKTCFIRIQPSLGRLAAAR